MDWRMCQIWAEGTGLGGLEDAFVIGKWVFEDDYLGRCPTTAPAT